ncbi:MAG: hypothetical protein HQ514_04760, partial [Rhodospirillales bacterium]|nr:hypothetical protein [Rhodospirillales bacterium]
MFIFQIRPRVFRIDAPASYVPSFPADAEIRFHLQPLQPFGMMAGGGRTTVRDVGASSFFNANTGVHTIESKMPLQPLEVVIEEPTRVFSLNGNVLAITETFDTFETLRQTIESVYFCLPMLLNVTFADSPTVERVDGTIGEYGFRWELSNWHMRFAITSQELQEERIVQAWQRMPLFADGSPRRRLLAALHYFHVACRLDISGETPGEFLPEMLLNLAKTLEVLFPPHGEGTSLDATRTGLRELGIENENIERDFVPAIALRNHVGVGHALIALFTSDQLKVLHEYTERAENAFRDMLDTMIQKIESGDF